MAPQRTHQICAAFVVLAAAASVWGTSEVVETSSTFCCCRLVLLFDPACDSTWSVHGTNVAYSQVEGKFTGCEPPCQKLEGGEMTLGACVDLNATTVCTETDVSVEKRVHYQSQSCPESWSDAAGPQAHAAALLLLLIIGGFVEKMFC